MRPAAVENARSPPLFALPTPAMRSTVTHAYQQTWPAVTENANSLQLPRAIRNITFRCHSKQSSYTRAHRSHTTLHLALRPLAEHDDPGTLLTLVQGGCSRCLTHLLSQSWNEGLLLLGGKCLSIRVIPAQWLGAARGTLLRVVRKKHGGAWRGRAQRVVQRCHFGLGITMKRKWPVRL